MTEIKPVCNNCHFFIKYSSGPDGEKDEIVSEDERDKIRNGEIKRGVGFRCSFGVWDEGFNFDKTRMQEILLQTNRQDFCFYWTYRPNMLTPAAKILQEREAKNREISKEQRLTKLGLWIAALALIVDVILRISGVFSNTP